MNKYFKFFVTALIILILLFTTCLNIFAYSDNFSYYLDTLNSTHIGVGTVTITRSTHLSLSSTYIVTTSQNGTGFVDFLFLGSDFVAGQSYTVNFRVARMSGSNARFDFFGDQRSYQQSPSEIAFYTSQLSSMCSSDQQWKLINFSFVSDGSNVYRVRVTPTSLSTSTNNFNVWFTQFSFSRYNPNAALESAVDEQNSLIDEQNGLIDEGNSLIDEQNSLIDEQNSQLFDGSEEFTGYEDTIDLEDSILEALGQSADDLFNSASDILSSERLQRGTLAITYFFNLFWSRILSIESTRWVRLLVYLSVTCSVFLLILHSGIIGNGGSKHGSNKGG